jgi:GNAT superfamily N-acetyltransferase
MSLELVHRESGSVVETLPLLPATEEHRAFILATWVRSYAATARKLVSRAVYTTGEPRIAERLWPKTYVLVSPDDSYTIHAWITCEPGKLYHIYVIPELRRKGIADALIRKLVGHKVEYAKPWPYDAPKSWTFNPYLVVE